MTKLGDTILEGLHQIKQMREGEDVGAKVHKMTNDKQIDKAKKALEKWAADEVLPPQPSVKRGFIRGYLAAIAATQEQLHKELYQAFLKAALQSDDAFKNLSWFSKNKAQ